MSDQPNRPTQHHEQSGQDAGGSSWHPPDDWDQLVSDALDDRLDGAERARLEQLTKQYPQAAERWQSYVEDQSRLREHFSQLADESKASLPSLPADFSKRVVQEARNRARSEADSPSHPLLLAEVEPTRLAGATQTSQQLSPSRRRSRMFVVAVAVAASLLLLAGPAVWQLGAPGPVAEQDLVGGQEDAVRPADGDVAQATEERSAVQVDDESGTAGGDSGPSPHTIVQQMPEQATDSTIADRRDAPALPTTAETPDVSAIADSSSTPRIPEVGQTAGGGMTEPSNLIDRPNPNGQPDATVSAGATDSMVAADAMAELTGAVLVYDVRLTRRGRAEQAVRRAMTQAGLEPASERKVDAELAGVARQVSEPSDGADTDDFQILYLQAPARQLDALFAELNEDRDGVASLGMTLATDAPIKKLTRSLKQVDPTQVKGSAVSWELTGEQAGSLGQLRRSLGGRSFIPMRTSGSFSGLQMESSTPLSPGAIQGPSSGDRPGQSTGDDVPSQVLLLVR